MTMKAPRRFFVCCSDIVFLWVPAAQARAAGCSLRHEQRLTRAQHVARRRVGYGRAKVTKSVVSDTTVQRMAPTTRADCAVVHDSAGFTEARA